jgi:glycosyltransferase involved in cell wall biosynthesis
MSYNYVLVTPAKNEAEFIELTIKSVISQTVLPARWVIVSDGSTDGTDDIVNRYAAEHPWIELVRMPERRERHFAGKVNAFNAGYARLKDVPYDVIGGMDGDISFDPQYFAFLLERLAANQRLGLVGTPFKDSSMYDYRFVSIEHVSGACQLFRRECFEDIGGYRPSKMGGVDHIAVLTARMKGWQTRTFTEKVCLHHRDMGSAVHGVWKAKYKVGALDYALGGHPLWEIFRTAISSRGNRTSSAASCRWRLRPASVRRANGQSPELVAFRRREQCSGCESFDRYCRQVTPVVSS